MPDQLDAYFGFPSLRHSSKPSGLEKAGGLAPDGGAIQRAVPAYRLPVPAQSRSDPNDERRSPMTLRCEARGDDPAHAAGRALRLLREEIGMTGGQARRAGCAADAVDRIVSGIHER